MELRCQRLHQALMAFGLLLGASLSGCIVSVNPTPIATVTVQTTFAVEPATLTSSATPSATSASGLTPTPSPNSDPTLTGTPITPVPTLPTNAQGAHLLNLIETNGGCELPCFLGIQPGMSSWEDIRLIEGPIYFREHYLPKDGRMKLYANLSETRNFDVRFWGFGSFIEHITVDARIYLPTDPHEYIPAFAEAVDQYALPNFLAQHGMPSRILLQVLGQTEPGAGTQAEVLLFYDGAGFVVQYFFLNVVTQNRETGVLRTCLDYEHTEVIRLYLQASDDRTPLEKLVGGANEYYFNSVLQPVEKITALSVEDFYRQFAAPNEGACFEVP